MPRYEQLINEWAGEVVRVLNGVFPTELEQNQFLNPEIPLGAVSGDYEYQSLVRRFTVFIRNLDTIRQTSLTQYTDLPMEDRLYVEHIDSFHKVRGAGRQSRYGRQVSQGRFP